MKINFNYKLREVAGETIIVNQGASSVDMTRIISLNASAKCLYQQLADREFTLEDAARVLEETYHIEHEQALTDAAPGWKLSANVKSSKDKATGDGSESEQSRTDAVCLAESLAAPAGRGPR